MIKRLFLVMIMTLMFLGMMSSAYADLTAVGPINLQNGYPLWWQDQNLTQIELCLAVANCPLIDPVAVGNPFSEQVGFGAESFWWAADAPLTANPAGLALFELAMEAAWQTEDPAAGDQLPFIRLRTRIDTAATGTYNISYPFGTLTVNVAAVGPGPEIIETIDIAGIPADIPPYSAALATGVPPVVAGGTAHGVSAFFQSATGVPPGFMGSGLAGPVVGIANSVVTITGPVADSFGPGLQTLTNGGNWAVQGKLFVPGVNLAPVANPDTAATSVGMPVIIDVVANDVDILSAGVNDHVINPRATGIGALAPFVLAPAIPVSTTGGGAVMKNSDGTMTYTPGPTFTGLDSFSYAVQDTGGLISTATATLTVVNFSLTEAELRPKLMKWNISGTAQGAEGANISIFAGPTASGTPIGTPTVDAGGIWSFEGKSSVSPGATGTISLALDIGLTLLDQPLKYR